mmetsp:Transcript_10981/g.16652  ORF Transcript_10981/g.16652 Transcript_10981/m.16652 type:complete len:81 (-) Transcript_10981:1498-1740(-)
MKNHIPLFPKVHQICIMNDKNQLHSHKYVRDFHLTTDTKPRPTPAPGTLDQNCALVALGNANIAIDETKLQVTHQGPNTY